MKIRSYRNTAAAMLAALATIATGAALATASAQAADDAAIRKTHAEFAAAWNKNDAKAVAAFWAPDGDVITPDGKVWTGRAQVEKFFTESFTTMLKGSKFSSTINNVRMLTPDIAVVDCAYQVEDEKDPAGKPMTEKGLYTTIHVHKDGKWWLMSVRPMIPFVPPSAPAAMPVKLIK